MMSTVTDAIYGAGYGSSACDADPSSAHSGSSLTGSGRAEAAISGSQLERSATSSDWMGRCSLLVIVAQGYGDPVRASPS